MPKELTLPLSEKEIEELRSGDVVLLNGLIYTARDAAHQRMIESIKKGEKLPIDLNNKTIYYAGPTPTKKGMTSGSIGPTTSYRMDPYVGEMLNQGLKIMIGKGPRDSRVKELLVKHKALYLIAVGGAAAKIASTVKNSKIIAYPELGAEAIHELDVEKFYAIVAYDTKGNDLFLEGIEKYKVR